MFLRVCFIAFSFLVAQETSTAQTTEKEMFWTWMSNSNDNVEISIKENSNSIVGTLCIVFKGGEKIDCSDSDEKNTELQKISSNVFEGSFYSSYFEKKIPIRFVFSKNKKKLTVHFRNKDYLRYNFPQKITFLSD